MSAESSSLPGGTATAVFVELRERNRTLFAVTLANLALAVVLTGLMALDGRTLLGRNVWTKPWKFATSIAIFTGTMGWILPSLRLSDRVETIAGYTIGGAMAIEIALISTQAARGVASHFNTSTSLDTAVFMIMGITITISSVAVAYVLWRVVRNPPALPAAYLWGIVLGMFLFVVTSFQGWLMIFQEGHAVGAANDGPGLPLLNWSLAGGDLRVSHFIGLHALQILPLTGYYASSRAGGSSRRSLGIVGVVGTLYIGFTGLTFIQALRGTPFVGATTVPEIEPSVVAAVFLLGLAGGVGVLAVLWRRHDPVDSSATG
jgi:hypothetical protein